MITENVWGSESYIEAPDLTHLLKERNHWLKEKPQIHGSFCSYFKLHPLAATPELLLEFYTQRKEYANSRWLEMSQMARDNFGVEQVAIFNHALLLHSEELVSKRLEGIPNEELQSLSSLYMQRWKLVCPILHPL